MLFTSANNCQCSSAELTLSTGTLLVNPCLCVQVTNSIQVWLDPWPAMERVEPAPKLSLVQSFVFWIEKPLTVKLPTSKESFRLRSLTSGPQPCAPRKLVQLAGGPSLIIG